MSVEKRNITGSERECIRGAVRAVDEEECLDRIIPIGEGHFRRAMSEFVVHSHRERNHQGLENALIEAAPERGAGRVYRHSRLGGLLNYYRRAA